VAARERASRALGWRVSTESLRPARVEGTAAVALGTGRGYQADEGPLPVAATAGGCLASRESPPRTVRRKFGR
jgi:hypothetical protein